MNKSELRQLIREELLEILKERQETTTEVVDTPLDEKSVPQPYNRKTSRKMSKSQIDLRKKIGKSMMSNEKTSSKFRKKYGDEWKDYIWAAASSAAFRQSGSSKADDKKK